MSCRGSHWIKLPPERPECKTCKFSKHRWDWIELCKWCLKQEKISFDCLNPRCLHLRDLCSNGSDASSDCLKDVQISRVDTPVYPCAYKEAR